MEQGGGGADGGGKGSKKRGLSTRTQKIRKDIHTTHLLGLSYRTRCPWAKKRALHTKHHFGGALRGTLVASLLGRTCKKHTLEHQLPTQRGWTALSAEGLYGYLAHTTHQCLVRFSSPVENPVYPYVTRNDTHDVGHKGCRHEEISWTALHCCSLCSAEHHHCWLRK